MGFCDVTPGGVLAGQLDLSEEVALNKDLDDEESLQGNKRDENSKENSKCKGPNAEMSHSRRPLWLDHWDRGKCMR